VLISTGGTLDAEALAAGWADRVDIVAGAWADTGGLSTPDAVLVRPDGYIAWAAPSDDDLTEALRRWFGAPLTRGSR
ncbi:MAG TPA: hypothetical protein VFO68_07645, partial [Actinophytocola sp.]|nr:hypothetical protein [Actinophytocola sp.]